MYRRKNRLKLKVVMEVKHKCGSITRHFLDIALAHVIVLDRKFYYDNFEIYRINEIYAVDIWIFVSVCLGGNFEERRQSQRVNQMQPLVQTTSDAAATETVNSSTDGATATSSVQERPLSVSNNRPNASMGRQSEDSQAVEACSNTEFQSQLRFGDRRSESSDGAQQPTRPFRLEFRRQQQPFGSPQDPDMLARAGIFYGSFLNQVQIEGRDTQDMRHEIGRLQSDLSVQVRASPLRLAQSGFEAFGRGDQRNNPTSSAVPENEDNEACGGVRAHGAFSETPFQSNVTVASVTPTNSTGTSLPIRDEDMSRAVYPQYAVTGYLYRVTGEGNLSQDEQMYYEVLRLQSFSSVQIRASPIRLSQSGFYATGSGDETHCYSCRRTHRNWRMMDHPDQIHRFISPDCPHLNRRDERNIPISRSENSGVYGVLEEYQVTTASDTATSRPDSIDATAIVTVTTATIARTPTEATSVPDLDISSAVYPQYRDLTSRLDSYRGWEWSHIQDPRVLASAGFYYAGYRDCVRCFYCGVGLRTWEREDDPWEEHVRWMSSCDYVRAMKGKQFDSVVPPTTQTQAQTLKTQESATTDDLETGVLSASKGRQLEEENQSLADESTCKICLANPSCIVFLPCGHLVTCAECAPALRKCPICRAFIRGTVRARVYM